MLKVWFRNVMILVLAAAMFTGCGSSKTATGGAIGAGAGGVIGAVIGKQAGNTAVGAILGAAVGGTAGALIGHYMDKQAEEMRRDIAGAKIERVGEGIKITFPSGILFQVNSAELQTDAQTNIDKLAQILNKYKDTNVLIEGHTDSTGTAEYNQALSERRAASVAQYAENKGVDPSRVTTKGYGETQPAAPNSTVDGRQKNRRVEVAIMANDELKKAAEEGRIEQ